MEDNTNATNEGTQAANVGQEGVQGATGTNDKRFTQEEVNSFIQSRLGRMKSKQSMTRSLQTCRQGKCACW